MAHPKHEAIRQRYQFRCGYCGVSEADAGGELTADHHQPVSAGGGDEDDNLVYACVRCNLYKGEYFPDVRALAAGHRVLHPLRDNITDHVREDIASQRRTRSPNCCPPAGEPAGREKRKAGLLSHASVMVPAGRPCQSAQADFAPFLARGFTRRANTGLT